MNHWPFIAAAYGLAFVAVASILVVSWRAMCAAETRADAIAGER